MKSLFRLLPLLRHDQFQSGTALADSLGVTRPTVAAWVTQMRELGVDIHVVKGRGYRLAEPISLLDRERIFAGLSASLRSVLHVLDIQTDLDSTNRWVMEQKPAPGQWSICAAEYQYQGRGRRGRVWRSPPASNLMVSIALRADLPSRALYAASLVAGVATVRALRSQLSVPVALKWPNDLYIEDAKLGGILCELQGNPQDHPVLAIGLGLNVSCKPDGLDQPAVALADVVPGSLDRNTLLIAIVNQLYDVFVQVQTDRGVNELLEEWGQYDCIRNRTVRLLRAQRTETVVARGVDDAGQLVVESADGERFSVNGGEVSVRW
ncbi:biotin--[acetyl-CoA-carboxylase] ligase [Saccharospirillum sp. MSK14-1]|uniref:biotin--[acetyl-CoA-carboxylase] ligase n=1 Tax=Saccharospirillum sp. MSK14-1 TaxID=1897632 RepID=UPI000D39B470|nr:biotin--[acetyl-CoA-carboxylase] ligase [Saccharospirillum sp. MSK14-1]PTY38380.1 biotin--[acetyl-CoA-carboxylase] ligase [Saccharospirillum sp. MSK14-1]